MPSKPALLVPTLRPGTDFTDRLASPLPLPHRGKKEEKSLTLSGRRRVRTPTSKDAASVNRDVERFDSAKAERIKAADQKTMTMPMAASRPPAPLISLHASKKRFSLRWRDQAFFLSLLRSTSLFLRCRFHWMFFSPSQFLNSFSPPKLSPPPHSSSTSSSSP